MAGSVPPGKKRCVACEHDWPEAAFGSGYGIRQSDNQVRCIVKSYCRARQLQAVLTAARALFAKFPRKLLLHLMDVRPADWEKSGWESVMSERERVYYCLIYHSLAFPVCMEFACRLNAADDDVEMVHVWNGGRWESTDEIDWLRPIDIAKRLNMHRQQVHRALGELRRLHLITVDADDRITVQVEPAALTLDERKAFVFGGAPADGADPQPAISREEHRVLGRMPQRYRNWALTIMAEAPDGLRTEIIGDLDAKGKAFNESLTDLRTARNKDLHTYLSSKDILIRRDSINEKAAAGAEGAPSEHEPVAAAQQPSPLRAEGAPSEHEPVAAAQQPSPLGIVVQANPSGPEPPTESAAPLTDPELAEMYAAGFGANAMSKLAARVDRPHLLAIYHALKQVGAAPGYDTITAIWDGCRGRGPVTGEDIAGEIGVVAFRAMASNTPLGFYRRVLPENVPAMLQRRAERALRGRPDTLPPRSAEAEAELAALEEEERLKVKAEAEFRALPASTQEERIREATAEQRQNNSRWERLTRAAQITEAFEAAVRLYREERARDPAVGAAGAGET